MLKALWKNDSGQDIAEYAVMLAVILLIVVGTIRLIGTGANTTFQNVASAIQQSLDKTLNMRHGRVIPTVPILLFILSVK